jgi:hypothetical protein
VQENLEQDTCDTTPTKTDNKTINELELNVEHPDQPEHPIEISDDDAPTVPN